MFAARFAIPQILEFYAATEGNFSLFNVEGKVGAIDRIPPLRFPMSAKYRGKAGLVHIFSFSPL